MRVITGSCQHVLDDLEKATNKYQVPEKKDENLRTEVKRVWKRLNSEPADIRELRDRITSNIGMLSTFLEGITK